MDFLPSENAPESFSEYIDSHKNVLFGDSARGLNIIVTLYNPRSDYWAHCQVLYEYSHQGKYVLSKAKANFRTFRVNIY